MSPASEAAFSRSSAFHCRMALLDDVPKIVAAAEVCLNNALKGDLKAFVKIMELAERFKLLDIVSSPPEITMIRHVIVDPRSPPNDGSPG